MPSRRPEREPDGTRAPPEETAAAAPAAVPGVASPEAVLALQRSAGNGAVSRMLMRRQWDVGSGRSVGRSPGPSANTREDVIDVQQRLHTLWDIETGDFAAENALVSAQPAESVVATGRIPRTMAALDKAERDDALAPPVAQSTLQKSISAGVGTGQPNKKEDVESVQHGLHASWDLSNKEFGDAQQELGEGPSVDAARMPVTLGGIKKLRQRYIEGHPGAGGARTARAAIDDPKAKAPAKGKYEESPDLSDELADAPMAATGKERAQLWLKRYAGIIEMAEKRHGVDRRAIAGAIAWEGLENVSNKQKPIRRWSGPGKVHYREGTVTEGNPASKVIGDEGYIPARDQAGRDKENEDPVGAITYVAAIMQAHAEAADAGGYDLRGDPAMLCTFYNAWDIKDVRALFSTRKKAPAPLTPNDMGNWVNREMAWVEAAVGAPGGEIAARIPKRGY